MSRIEILFDARGNAISHTEISARIIAFGNSYNDAVKEIINNSTTLDIEGEVFIKCASRLLANFGMTRKGAFHGNNDEILHNCWNAIGDSLIEINRSVLNSGLSRDRYILELNDPDRDKLIAEIWLITKKLLPFTMGDYSYGLVGASKILFSVFPEIVLPIDNAQWLHIFKTVDLGDVLHRMVFDIQKWEGMTEMQLNGLDPSKRLTTLPSVYNVMAMLARPTISGIEKKNI
jgi:hypothetical protein